MRDVPFVETYNFDFVIGPSDRGSHGGRDRSADLRIFSAADLSNMLSAANVSTNITGGVISGMIVFGPSPVSGALLDVRDFNGRPVRDVFYNGLGGVPDFVAADGTAEQGSFTVFNVPEGEAFIQASGGARGVNRVGVYDQAISIKPMQVVPVVVSETGVTGPIEDWHTILKVFPVRLSALGLQSDTRFSDDRGLLQETPLVGFRVVLPSNSVFTLHGETAGYEETFQEMDTSLADRGTAVDLTRFLNMVSTEWTDEWYRQAVNINPDFARVPGTGIIVGKSSAGGGTPREHNRLHFSTFDGEPAGVTVSGGSTGIWFTGKGNLHPPGDPAGASDTVFVALNVPPGPVFFRGAAHQDISGYRQAAAGAATIQVFPDAVTVVEVDIPSTASEEQLIVSTITSVNGVITLSDLVTPVSDVLIDVGGYAGGPGTYDGPIRSRTAISDGNYVIHATDRSPASDSIDQTLSNLPANGEYVFRVSDLPGNNKYVDTYQLIDTKRPEIKSDRSLEVLRNLQVFTRTELEAMAAVAGIVLDPTRSVIIGRVLDPRTLSTAEGIELRVFNQYGESVGEVRYMDTNGLPQRVDSTSGWGEFVAFNVPPGTALVHVISTDDTGSLSTYAYAGGITVLGTVFVGDAPVERVPVAGQVRDLKHTLIGGAKITFHGEPSRDAADSGFLSEFSSLTGSFATELSVLGDFIASVDAGGDYYTTLKIGLETGMSPVSDQALLVVSRTQADQVANDLSGGTLVQDADRGIVVGDVRVRAWIDDPEFRDTIDVGISGPTAISSALLNGDTYPDLIVANGDSDEVSIYFGSQAGTFQLAGRYPVGLGPVDLVGMDVDGDGLGDVLVLTQGASSGEINVLLGTPRGAFRPDPSRRLHVQNAPREIRIGDLDGDGSRDDLVVLNSGGTPSLSVFFRNEDQRFVEAPYSPALLDGVNPTAISVQDVHPIPNDAGQLNTDPIVDDVVVVMEGSDTVETYGNAGTRLVREFPLFLPAGSRPVDVLRFDINQDAIDPMVDRDLEYIVLNAGTNTVNVYEVDPDTASIREIAPPVNLDTGCAPTSFTMADTNRDRRGDLVVLCSGTGTVSVYLGAGAGFFFAWQCAEGIVESDNLYHDCRRPPLVTGDAPSGLVTGFYDQSAGVDVVIANRFSDSLTLYHAASTPLVGVPAQVLDIDGNPVQDIAYLDDNGNLIPAATSTGTSGRFMAFNVPPGNMWLTSTSGDNGNRRMVVFPGQVSYSVLDVTVGSRPSVTLLGQVVDAVGSTQPDIDITFSATGISEMSGQGVVATGTYEAVLPSNLLETTVRLTQP